jgi:hypothetical protein
VLDLIGEHLRNPVAHARRLSAATVRRSGSSEVAISLTSVVITVIDQGVGFDSYNAMLLFGHRFGLAQLRERGRTAGHT